MQLLPVLAVTFRFRWWQRLLLYGTWIAILVFSDSIKFGARSSLDPGTPLDRQILISTVGSGILLALTALFVWLPRQEMAKAGRGEIREISFG